MAGARIETVDAFQHLCETHVVDLNEALNQFDATETTLQRLKTVQRRLTELIPQGIAFIGDSPEGIAYENLCRAFRELVGGLPAIDGWMIEAVPLGLDEIAQSRLDAQEIGEFEAMTWVERGISAPGESIREYEFRFNRVRQALVRQRAQLLLDEIGGLLAGLVTRVERDNTPLDDPAWTALVTAIGEVERLTGGAMTRTGRWTELHRHLAFAQGYDVHDIAEHDWPSVLIDIKSVLYGEFEPMPVQVADLADLAATRPNGPVSIKLAWDSLEDEDFERLIFNLISDAPGYENPQWLTRTNAPDRGRDLSVDRVVADSLSGVVRQRVIIQCKHWLTKSVGPSEIGNAVITVKLWEPPPIDVLLVATSGRFSADAVAFAEKHNHARERPAIEMWAESHLELLLAPRAQVVKQFGLRPGG